eukprot:208093-Rhodomonas_salina.1
MSASASQSVLGSQNAAHMQLSWFSVKGPGTGASMHCRRSGGAAGGTSPDSLIVAVIGAQNGMSACSQIDAST